MKSNIAITKTQDQDQISKKKKKLPEIQNFEISSVSFTYDRNYWADLILSTDCLVRMQQIYI